ncbi:MAG: hypothetical protein NT011_10975 [Kiritimatiellaeota bacterium]|nr:hypothetical protein [Kiritimatiellota bacterium]
MRKWIVSLMVGMLLVGSTLTASAMNENRGGLMGFIAGCCFGMRAGADYNDGKEVHWREWISLIIPIIPPVWAGIDGANGMTTDEYVKKYGSTFF